MCDPVDCPHDDLLVGYADECDDVPCYCGLQNCSHNVVLCEIVFPLRLRSHTFSHIIMEAAQAETFTCHVLSTRGPP